MLPWTHLQVRPDGKVYSCCLADVTNDIGDLHKQTLPEIWNSPGMRKLRREMMNGQMPEQCTYCYNLEKDTGGSFRKYSNDKFLHHFETMIGGTDETGHASKFNVVYMDFRLSNICNFRCRSCGTFASSSWHSDQLKMRSAGRKILDTLRGSPEPEKIQLAYNGEEHLEEILDQIVPTLEEIYFAGGEPLIMDEHYRILDALIAAGRTGVKIRYNTNFSKLEFRDRDVCQIWNQFKDVAVQASLDDSYERGEYLRKGQNWKRTVANRQRMFKDCPHVKFEISATISAYNVWHIPDFFREWVDLGYVAQDKFFLNPLYGPAHMRMQVLPPEFKAQTIEKYERFVSEFVTDKWAHRRFQGIIDLLKEPDESKNMTDFLRWTRKLDGLRSESFVKAFPELAPYA